MEETTRFYPNKYPLPDEIVYLYVNKITDMGVEVSLLEYNNIPGYISMSEVTRKKVKSLKQLIRENQTCPAIVLRVDEKKGNIDLSKHQLSSDEIKTSKEKYSKAKELYCLFHGILIHLRTEADKWKEVTLEQFLEKTLWNLYKITYKNNPDTLIKFLNNTTYEALKRYVNFENTEDQLQIIRQIAYKIKEKYLKEEKEFTTTFKLICFHINGVSMLKKVIKETLDEINKKYGEVNILIKTLRCPEFQITVKNTNSEIIIDFLKILEGKSKENNICFEKNN